MIKLLIVDDHKMIRDGIKTLLSGSQEIKVIGECSNGKDAVEFIEKELPDVVLLDINMPVMNGIDCCELICKKHKSIKVIILSMHDEHSYISKMLRVGAVGYVLKNSELSELSNAIKQVMKEGMYYSKEVADIMMKRFINKENTSSHVITSIEDISDREKEVLKLIADGLTNNQIADKLYLSPRTVESHRRNLLQKIGVGNTAGLVRFAIENSI